MSTPLIGQTLGQYRIVEQLGAGGMGVVYKAQDVRLGRLVALKVLPHTAAEEQVEAIERFRREARTASSLNHPNICTIFSFDEHHGQLYLAMELLEGETLDRKLSGRPLDLRLILELGSQIADALDAAHSEGILHRDIKPANIFLTRRGQVKVLDFGLAKLAPGFNRSRDDSSPQLTEQFTSMVGTTVGTVAYMSPEQARGEDVDPRTDLFSFGVVLYEMATGRQSFSGATTAVVFDGILNRDPQPPSTINTAIPVELDRIISKALEKDRSLRYQSAADLRADLQRLRRDSGSRRVTTAMYTPPAPAASRPAYEGVPPSDPSSAQTVFFPAAPGTSASGQTVYTPSAPTTPIAPANTGVAPPPPITNKPRAGWSPMMLAAAAIFLVALLVMIGYAMLIMPAGRSALTMADSVNPTPTPQDVLDSPAPPLVAAPSAAISAPPMATAAPAASAPSVNATTTKPVSGLATKAPASAPSATDTAASERLEAARAKVASNQLEAALADLRQILVEFPGTPAAVGASYMSADVLEKLGRADEAIAAYDEFAKRYAADSRAAASRLRTAELIARSRRPNREAITREVLSQVIANYPKTPQALQALLMKMKIDTERRQRELDPVLGIQVPAVLPTLRSLTEQFPTHATSMIAFNRLAELYEDLDQFERAAQALNDLGVNFPNNPYDTWYQLGEIYERRLKDPARAREAYAKVPASSSRYRDAQRKLGNR